VFDGWFLKTPPQDADALREPINALERECDPQAIWRSYCNRALADYAPLWRRIDRLLLLQGPGFEVVPEWRWQQEVALQAAHPGSKAKTRAEIDRFVLFFERVGRQALRTLPTIADRTVRIDAQRRPIG
jgi:D-glycerate 3-kinase